MDFKNIVATAAIHIISKHFIPAEFILFTDTALTNNMHHPNIITQLFAHNNIISVEACLILSLTYKLHTEMIHINLTPNTEGQFKDIPTKLELRAKDMYTSHKQELIKTYFD